MSDLSLTHPAPRPPKAGRFRAPTDEAPAARRALIGRASCRERVLDHV